MKLTDYDAQIKELTAVLTATPPDLALARRLLDEWKLPSPALSAVACEIVNRHCFYEYSDAIQMREWVDTECYALDANGEIVEERLVSYYLPDILELLLDFGMNPNDIIVGELTETNLIDIMQYVAYKDRAAYCVRLLMEHGGDPNLAVDGETVLEDVDFNVIFDIDNGESRPPCQPIQVWITLIGFGGRLKDGRLPVTMTDGYSPEIFREYEKFRWEIEWVTPTKKRTDHWIIHIYEIATDIEVAQF
jgi:hypothetical protein